MPHALKKNSIATKKWDIGSIRNKIEALIFTRRLSFTGWTMDICGYWISPPAELSSVKWSSLSSNLLSSWNEFSNGWERKYTKTIKISTIFRTSCPIIYYILEVLDNGDWSWKDWHKLYTLELFVWWWFPSMGFFQIQEADRSLDFTLLIRTAPEMSLYVTIMSISCIK